MKLLKYLTVAIWIVAIATTWTKYRGSTGLYAPYINVIWCSDEFSCLHEVGHFVDTKLDNPSQSEEFRVAVQNCIETCANQELRNMLIEFPIENGCFEWGGYRELYAELYALYQSDFQLPYELIAFFKE
jgi:hypothetical protein